MTPDWILAVEQVQQEYVREYSEFCRRQMEEVELGSPEVAFELSENATVLRRLYRVDFASNDQGTSRVVELDHPAIMEMSSAVYEVDGIRITISPFQWSAVLLRLEGAGWSEASVLPWFDDWFGLESGREAAATRGEPGGMIHSAMIDGHDMYIDFGSAPADSLVELVDIARHAGAGSVLVLNGLTTEEGEKE